MIRTWAEILEVEAAIRAIADGAGAATRVQSVFGAESSINDDLYSAMTANNEALISLRDWARSEREKREAEDARRKSSALARWEVTSGNKVNLSGKPEES